VGSFDPSTATFYLRYENNSGAADAGQFQFGLPGWAPVSGKWTGVAATVGVVDNTGDTGTGMASWYLAQYDQAGTGLVGGSGFIFGLAGWIPLAGDWTGSGTTGIGMYDPKTATFYLRNTPTPGAPNEAFTYGLPGWLPVVGDWNGSGHDEVAVVNPATETWYLNSTLGPSTPNSVFTYGAPGWTPVAGDWTGSGKSGIAVVDPSGNWYQRNSPTPGGANNVFGYGAGTWKPVSGMWASPGQLQLASGGPGSGTGVEALTADVLQQAVTAALERLEAAGVSASTVSSLSQARLTISDLPGGELGLTDPSSDHIWIDATADGYGWYTDPSSSSDALFGSTGVTSSGPAAGQMDLETVVLHELAHLVGQIDVSGGNSLMTQMLPTGTRRVDALDSIFSGK
jgi:hypothetical protein